MAEEVGLGALAEGAVPSAGLAELVAGGDRGRVGRGRSEYLHAHPIDMPTSGGGGRGRRLGVRLRRPAPERPTRAGPQHAWRHHRDRRVSPEGDRECRIALVSKETVVVRVPLLELRQVLQASIP